MDDIFCKATRYKIRFDTVKGALSVEDLWDLPLSSDTGKANLDSLAVYFNAHIKSGLDVSFVNPDKAGDPMIQLAFDVVKAIIDVKLAEAKEAREAREKSQKKQRIREILANKKDEADQSKSIDELEAELASL